LRKKKKHVTVLCIGCQLDFEMRAWHSEMEADDHHEVWREVITFIEKLHFFLRFFFQKSHNKIKNMI